MADSEESDKVEMDDIQLRTHNDRAGGSLEEDDNTELWNIFRKDRQFDSGSCCDGFADTLFKILKLLTYIFLFLIVLTGVIVSKGSLQILVTLFRTQEMKFSTRTPTQDYISYLLFFIIAIPDALKFLQCALQFIFGNRESPTCIRFILILVREGLHLFGLSNLVFKVMPYLDPLQTCVVIVSTALVPSFVNSVAYCRKTKSGIRTMLKKILNFICSLVILATIVIVPYQILQSEDDTKVNKGELVAWTITSIFLLSFRWIETYSLICRRFIENHKDKNIQDEGYVLSHMFSSLLRIIVLVILFPTFYCPGIRGINTTFSEFATITDVSGYLPVNCSFPGSNSTSNSSVLCQSEGILLWSVLGPFLVHILTAIITNHCAVIACRLWMQVVGFAIPLTIASPIYAVILVILHEVDTSWLSSDIGNLDISDDFALTLIFFLIGWFGQAWLCRHIWGKSREERLAFTNRMFVLPHFCSPVLDLSLLHSRKKIVTKGEKKKEKVTEPPMVYICATMWHENRIEMKQILISIFRLDFDQFQYEYSKNKLDNEEKDYYQFEAHIPFDDAMETNKSTNKRGPNDFVRQLMEIVDIAATTFYKRPISLDPPKKICTPYGGRLEWTLPGENKLVVHLKDKDKIRHKKRWSQIMYMYYFVGYELMEKNRDSFESIPEFEEAGSIFEQIPDKIKSKAENTYILALDGDVDFQPEAIQLLIDRMKINPQVGATCGRIKPGGSGPVVWYQRFEYAIGHWLQKAAEHMFGCVLCSPGCFSLFRVKSLMDDNVMRTYATLPTEARHFLQYDQGEDRWLCTLLLQQGYKIEYCAGAEAITFAPEEFKEFFNQRRRWMPSTMANILDLLQSYSRTTRVNPNISYFYIFYQIILFASSILGPSTVLLAMQSAVASVFNVAPWVAYLLTYGPTVIFIFVCLKFKTDTQLNFAMVLSALYALLMMAVFVGTLVSIASEGWYTPTGVFFYILVGTFLIAGILHPHEFGDLVWGVLYFICIPAGYLFLIIYAICNLNNVSWGTRENKIAVLEQVPGKQKSKKKETEDELGLVTNEMIEGMLKQVKETNVSGSTCMDSLFSIFRWVNNLIVLKSLESVQNIFEKSKDESDQQSDHVVGKKSLLKSRRIKMARGDPGKVDDESWSTENVIGSKPRTLEPKEVTFWNNLIQHYLYPLEADPKKEKQDKDNLADLRNKVAFGFFFMNALWLTIITAMNEVKHIINITITQSSGPPIIIEPLGFVFLVVFALLLLLQFVGMLMHRYETFIHIISITKLRTKEQIDIKKQIGQLASEPGADYDASEEEEEDPIYSNVDIMKACDKKENGYARNHYVQRHGKNRGLNLRKTVRHNMNSTLLRTGTGGQRNMGYNNKL